VLYDFVGPKEFPRFFFWIWENNFNSFETDKALTSNDAHLYELLIDETL